MLWHMTYYTDWYSSCHWGWWRICHAVTYYTGWEPTQLPACDMLYGLVNQSIGGAAAIQGLGNQAWFRRVFHEFRPAYAITQQAKHEWLCIYFYIEYSKIYIYITLNVNLYWYWIIKIIYIGGPEKNSVLPVQLHTEAKHTSDLLCMWANMLFERKSIIRSDLDKIYHCIKLAK